MAWHEVWQQRFGCWWIALPVPTQSQLGNCLGAFSLHLGARLDLFLGRPHPAATPTGSSECEWVGGEAERLHLPDFPPLDGFEFKVPPLPRLLPGWELMQLYSHRQLEPMPGAAHCGMLAMLPAMAVGLAGSSSVASLMAIVWMRRRLGRAK